LNKVSVGSVDNNYDDSRRQLVGLDSKTFSLSGLSSVCPCVSGQKSTNCEFRIEYLTATGLTKTEYKTIKVDCVTDSIPTDPGKVVPPISSDSIPPSVSLSTPVDKNIFSGRNLSFSFTPTDETVISSCILRIGSDSNTYYNLTNGVLNTIAYTKSGNDGAFDWNITCSDGTNSTPSSSRRIFMDANTQQIGSCIELQDMNKNLSGNYELMNDVDCGADTNNSSGALWNGGAGFKPVGTSATAFSGTFNGNYNEIRGLYVKAVINRVGLFGYLTGSIFNVGLIDNNVNSSLDNIGGLVGYSSGTISNSYSIGSITGTGYMYSSNVGGLVGQQDGGTIRNSYSSGKVKGYAAIGGLVGLQWLGTISNSYSSGDANGYTMVGGLVGRSYATVSSSYSIGRVMSDSIVSGGLVGQQDAGTISNCYATGYVYGSNYFGGLIGQKISSGTTLSNSYWDINRSGRSSCCAIGTCTDCFGKNSANLDPNAFFSNVVGADYNVPVQHNTIATNDWNFTSIWKRVDNNYPILIWQ